MVIHARSKQGLKYWVNDYESHKHFWRQGMRNKSERLIKSKVNPVWYLYPDGMLPSPITDWGISLTELSEENEPRSDW